MFEIIENENKSAAPIKAWTRGVLFEDQAKQQVRNIASMPFVFKHVAVMPDVHAGIGATVGSVIATNKTIIPAAVGVDIGCFSGDTMVPLLDGTQRSMLELVDRSEPFWVYSVDNGRIVPGKAIALKTRENADLIEIQISGGSRIVCTPDHEFMMRDGSYKRADTLKFNDSLMPLYRKYATRDGYESVKQPSGGTEMTHQLVAGLFLGAPEGRVAHHIDHNHFNNVPENLIYMSAEKHSEHHRATDDSVERFRSEEFKKNRLDKLRKNGFYSDYEKKSRDSIANLKAGQEAHPEKFAENYAAAGKRGAPVLSALNVSPRDCELCGETLPNLSAHNWHMRKKHDNHKVVSINPISKKEDVYCLQVEKYHNFALAAGVFVHNCGMMALRTSLRADQLPDNLKDIRHTIESKVPHGRTDNGGKGDRGAWTNPPENVALAWKKLEEDFKPIIEKHPQVNHKRAPFQICSLGTGNHFIELCLDTENQVWIMLHSGSRGVGNAIGSHFISLARKEMERFFINLPDKDLAYLPEGTEYFRDYVQAVSWAQRYALVNRELMMNQVILALRACGQVPPDFTITEEAINCHHNYIAKEHHFGSDVWVTRKGAVRARENDLGIIPGSMGAKSFIVRGKGNPESFTSCSHGAGRRMSRTQAKKEFTVEDQIKATEGVECRKDKDVIDEIPMAYKSIDDVMAAQQDLVDIVFTIKQVLCVKG